MVTVRFLATKTGTVHVVDRDPSDRGGTSCPTVGRMLNAGSWKGQRSLKPEAALAGNDCTKCETHKTARREIRLNKAHVRPTVPGRRPNTATNAAEIKADAKSRLAKHQSRTRLRHDSKTQEVNLKPKEPEAPIQDKGQRLADEHAKLAKDHGWIVEVQHVTDSEWLVIARKGDEWVQAAWIDGKVDYPRVIAVFPSYTFWLKNTTQWRRQVSLPDSERPAKREPKNRPPRVPVASRSVLAVDPGLNGAVVVEVEGDGIKFNSTDLPFAKDAPDAEIIDLLRGHILHWRNNFASKIEKAEVPTVTRLIRISEHPTNGRRIVSFPEVADYTKDGVVYGCERSVAIDQMIKVRN